jgi:Zn-dependent protease
MLRNLFSPDGLIQFLFLIPIVLFSLSFHEFAHGYIAHKCGDNTARNFGRLTLNPLKHLDIIGAIMLFAVGFGWAKPVPISMRNFRKPKRDLALVSIAGPIANFILVFVGIGLFTIVETFLVPFAISRPILLFLYLFSTINAGLGVFNLIPLPPLDGSKIIMCLLPPHLAVKYSRIERYSSIIFLVLILSSYISLGRFGSVYDFIFQPIEWLRNSIISGAYNFYIFIFSLFGL